MRTSEVSSGSAALGGPKSVAPEWTESASAFGDPTLSFPEIVDHLVEGVTVMRRDGRFIFANSSARRILGIGLEVMNQEVPPPAGWRQLTEDGEEWTEDSHPAAVSLRTGRACADVIMRFEKPDGITAWVSVNTQPLFRDGDPLPYAVVTSLSDVTEQRRAQEEILFQKTVLEAQAEASSDGILVLDPDGRVLFSNSRFQEIWRFPSEGVREDPAERLSHFQRMVADPDAFAAMVARFRRHPDQSGWHLIRLRDGRTLDHFAGPVRGEDGTHYGRVAYFHDVTDRLRAEEAIRLQKTLLEVQTEASRDGIILVGADRRILSCNRRCREMWGVDEGIIGRPVAEVAASLLPTVANAEDFTRIVRRFVTHLDEERPDGDEFVFRDGRVLRSYGSPVHREDGSLFGRVVYFQDVTEQRHAREALERLSHRDELILNSAADSIIGLDSSGRVTFANPSAARSTGFTPLELIGQPLHAFLEHTGADGTRYPPEDDPILRVLETGRPGYASGDVFRRKDGTTFPVEYVSAPIAEGDDIVGAVVTFKDISERYRVEKMKDEFISVVSHELRTPLTSIRGSLGLLAGGLVGTIPPRAQRMLDIAVKNTDRLVGLINDILDIERIESGKVTMQWEHCDAGQVIAHAAEVMQAMAEQAQVTIEVAPAKARLFADSNRLIQVVTNLLSNAIKFSAPGGRIRVSAERRDDQILFRVKDDGRGIPVDKLDTIFGRFQQVDASDSRDKGGTGLGLAICRSIVQQHGGRIWAESGPAHGQGSTFSFTIPVERKKPRHD